MKIKLYLFAIIILASLSSKGDAGKKAWEDFQKAQYSEISNNSDDDAVIIFDRAYYKTSETMGGAQVSISATFHRKIKINSLFGLEKFNKLYIPTVSDLNFKIQFVNCEAKTLKKNKKVIRMDTSILVTTTLPANTPFYYKKEGKVKMLAISDVNIGDEIEYIYTVKYIYETSSEYFYKFERVPFSSRNFCMEKTLIFESYSFETDIWKYNFGDKKSAEEDYFTEEENAVKVSMNDINRNSNQPYTNNNLDQPYIIYLISIKDDDDRSIDSWASFAKFFKPRRRDTKKSYIFNGEKTLSTLQKVDRLKTTNDKFEYILKQVNNPLIKNFGVYKDVEDDIDVALAYAQVISKLLKVVSVPVNFHFVVDKNLGIFDTTNITLYQFDNIICSYIDESGKQHYMPLLEPYLEIDEIKSKFQGTNCFTILQDEKGKRSIRFDRIPISDRGRAYVKEVEVNIVESSVDSVSYSIDEKIEFVGDLWIDLKPIVSHIIYDSTYTIKNFSSYVLSNIITIGGIDSVSNLKYEVDENSFTVSYSYDYRQKTDMKSKIFALKSNLFINQDFYTPYHLRGKREFPGYLFDQEDLQYTLRFNFKEKYDWLENTVLNDSYKCSIGKVSMGYEHSETGLTITYNYDYLKDKFQVEEWPEMLKLRDLSYDFLNTNLYFKNRIRLTFYLFRTSFSIL